MHWFTAQPGDGAQIYVARHGQADWEANFLLFDHFAQTATLPLQYVFADHYRLDVLHVDDELREVLGRLWLTVLIDAFSRAVLGLYLAYEAPCIESIQGALRHAIWPKADLTEFGIDLPWACYGIPQRLSLDNAWAHHSYSLEDLARALGGGGRYTAMELLFRPPYQARYGGLVERLFGNLSGQLRERLPGALLHPPSATGTTPARAPVCCIGTWSAWFTRWWSTTCTRPTANWVARLPTTSGWPGYSSWRPCRRPSPPTWSAASGASIPNTVGNPPRPVAVWPALLGSQVGRDAQSRSAGPSPTVPPALRPGRRQPCGRL